jgi:TolB-like protein/class 3 adenylate cyclase/Tfp pilus assembly protein PilF
MATERINRKLAAILAADVVGFSRLTGLDEEGTARRLAELRADPIDPAIAAYGGRIFKIMGDGLLIEFGSVVDATRCALDLQSCMASLNAGVDTDKRIEFRVGIHIGDVMAQPDGDLLGDGVNIAARLEGISEPGGVCLSRAAYEQVRDKLKETFADLGEKALKNIARPVQVYAARTGSLDTVAQPPGSATVKAGPPRLSIVVLPFVNMGGDTELEYFVDGVTESLTTDLSRIPRMVVIGRNTAFTYKNKAVDLKQIGRDLNVRYALEGSIQRGGARMRVNVQLVETETGGHLWSERFDMSVANLFDMQDEIVARLASQLDTELLVAEASHAERAVNPDAMDLFFRGWAALNSGVTRDLLAKARDLFEAALTLDPTNSNAAYGVACVDANAGVTFQAEDRALALVSAENGFNKALTLNPRNANAHLGLGAVLAATNRPLLAIAAYERALSLNGNLGLARGHLGYAKILIGRPDETEAHIEEALRFSPRDRFVFVWLSYVAAAKVHLGADEEAVAWYRRSIGSNPNYSLTHFFLGGCLARLGQVVEARASVQAGLALDPHFTVRRFEAGRPSEHPRYVAGHKRHLEGLRKAGVPEG